MLLFTIKKAFFDLWDNLIPIILLNISIILLLTLIFLGANVCKDYPVPLFFSLIAGIIIINFYLAAVFRYVMDISDYQKAGFRTFFTYFKHTWKQGIAGSLIMILEAAILFYVIPYYYSSDSIFFIVIGTLMFWVWLTIFLSCINFLPVCFRFKKKMLKNLQSCFLFFFDNIGFVIFMLLGIIILVVASFFFTFFTSRVGCGDLMDKCLC